MHKHTYTVFCLDYREFKSANDLDIFFKQANLDMVGSEWYELYLGNWIKGVVVNKVWVDSVTLCIVAYETNQEQMIYPNFAEYLSTMKPIDTSFKYGKIHFPHLTPLSLDTILEKIFQFGPDSLTQEEKDFLNKSSNEI